MSTVSVAARALSVVPATSRVGFSAPTEPWNGLLAFARSDAPQLPPGVRLVAADQLNELDRAADRAPAPAATEKAGALAGASLVTPANAAEPGEAPRTNSSVIGWIYDKIADGLLTAALAVRSAFR